MARHDRTHLPPIRTAQDPRRRPARPRRSGRAGPGLAAPAPPAVGGRLRDRPRPHRSRPGRGEGRPRPAPRWTASARRPSSRCAGAASRNPQAPDGVEVVDPAIEPLGEPSATPPVELWRPELSVSLPTLLDHAVVTWRHPRRQAVWQLAAASLRGFRDALSARGLHRDADTQDRRQLDRVRRERVRPRLLRAAGLPRAVAAVLQAGAGRRVRAGLRGRPGVPGRAARHGPAPGGVRLARRRAGLHPRPPRRAGRAARRAGRAWSPACSERAPRRSSCWA